MKIVRIVVGVMLIATGFFGLTEDILTALVCLVIGAVLIIWPMLKGKKSASVAVPAGLKEMTFKVKGVSFSNNDGSSRQKNLERLYAQQINDPVTFKKYTYEGSPALYVLCNGLCIGNVPAEKVDTVLQVMPNMQNAWLKIDSFSPEEDLRRTLYNAECVIQYTK